MIRNMLRLLVLISCFFAGTFVTQSSDSQNGLTAYATAYTWVVPFNDWNDFYDKHCAEITMTAPQNYFGWYNGTATVTGNGETDDDNIGEYYTQGTFAWTSADLTFYDNPNEDISGTGYGWGRIHGTARGNWNYEEAEDSYFTDL